MLYYFQKKEATRDAPYYGSIPLHGGTQLHVSADSSTSFSLIAPDRVYYFRAPSPDEHAAWIAVLRSETLGTVKRLDDEDAPEKQRAKRDFSRNTILVPSQTPVPRATFSGSAPGAGDYRCEKKITFFSLCVTTAQLWVRNWRRQRTGVRLWICSHDERRRISVAHRVGDAASSIAVAAAQSAAAAASCHCFRFPFWSLV